MKAYIELMEKAHSSIVASDTAEKDFFMEVYGELKSGDGYDLVCSNIKKHTTELIVQRQLITIVNMAKDYVGSTLFTRILEMRWYNVKALVALIRYINKEHGAGKVKSIKGRISKAGKEFSGAENNVKYNNAIASLIMTIKEEYKVVITDDSKVMTKNIKAMYNGLTDAQKMELFAMLSAEFEVQEEVA